jgi:hypothetical protein
MTLKPCRGDEKCLLKDSRLPVTSQGREDPKKIRAALMFTARFKDKVSADEKKTLCNLAKKHNIKNKLC